MKFDENKLNELFLEDTVEDDAPYGSKIKLNQNEAVATIFDWLGSLFMALVIVLLIMTFGFRIIDVDGKSMDAMGNMHLLSYREKIYVQCTNRLDDAGLEAARRRFIAQALEGKVVVTAGISRVEKDVMNWALNNGHEMILVVENGMSPLWKPAGKQFEACANGTLLIVAPWEYSRFPHKISRSKCLAMNDVALAIVEGRVAGAS